MYDVIAYFGAIAIGIILLTMAIVMLKLALEEGKKPKAK